jgi:hypothetical protein
MLREETETVGMEREDIQASRAGNSRRAQAHDYLEEKFNISVLRGEKKLRALLCVKKIPCSSSSSSCAGAGFACAGSGSGVALALVSVMLWWGVSRLRLLWVLGFCVLALGAVRLGSSSTLSGEAVCFDRRRRVVLVLVMVVVVVPAAVATEVRDVAAAALMLGECVCVSDWAETTLRPTRLRAGVVEDIATL